MSVPEAGGSSVGYKVRYHVEPRIYYRLGERALLLQRDSSDNMEMVLEFCWASAAVSLRIGPVFRETLTSQEVSGALPPQASLSGVRVVLRATRSVSMNKRGPRHPLLWLTVKISQAVSDRPRVDGRQ